jgi:hypothetical protein
MPKKPLNAAPKAGALAKPALAAARLAAAIGQRVHGGDHAGLLAPLPEVHPGLGAEQPVQRAA